MTQHRLHDITLLVAAPDGIEVTRRLVLNMAVRGLLVEQLAVEGRAEVSVATEVMDAGPVRPHGVPETWTWAPVSSLCRVVGGGTPKAGEAHYWADMGRGVAWLTPADLNGLKDKYVHRGRRDISEAGLRDSSAQLLPVGSVLFSSRAPIGYVAIAASPLSTNQGFKSCVPGEQVLSEYLYWYLKWCAPTVDATAPGTTFREVSGAAVGRILVAVPPIREQRRIVAKVDELMALCDRLEARQLDAEAAHAGLVQALLDSLAQARDTDEFQACWQRLAPLLPEVLTTEAAVESMRRTCIQLGVRGFLCQTLVTDGNAADLLDAIVESRTRAWGEGAAPRPKAFSQIAPEAQPYNLPTGWRWVRLGQLGVASTGSTPPSSQADAFGGSTPFIGPGQISAAGLISTGEKSLSDKGRSLSTVARPKDLLMVCIGGSIGKSALADRELAFNQQINSLTVLDASPEFVHLVMRSPEFQQSVLSAASGSATPIINRSKWEDLTVPLPPLAAQLRIVAKVTELLALCDQLQARIAAARAKHAQLAEALVEAAVA